MPTSELGDRPVTRHCRGEGPLAAAQATVPLAGAASLSQRTTTEPSSLASPVKRLTTVIWPVASVGDSGLQALTNAELDTIISARVED